MVAPNWVTMGENRYTPLVSTLLVRLYPDAQSSTAPGATVAATRNDRPTVKTSFTSSNTSGPDRQNPAGGTQAFVDGGGAERSGRTWFEGLKKAFPFVTTWHGRHWLDSAPAAHQDIVRYYGDSNAEVIAALKDLREEQAVLLGGVPDVVSRVEGLQARADEISPEGCTTAAPGRDLPEESRPCTSNLADHLPRTPATTRPSSQKTPDGRGNIQLAPS